MNNSGIKVSVIMPVYNARDFLAPAIDSVLGQTLREIELICIDDGSTDGSLDILKEYRANDERVRIVTETNAGPAIARNNGIRRARGEYIAFLDADDFFEPDLIEELYNIAEADALDIAIADYDVYNSRKSRFEKPVYPEKIEIFKSGKVTSVGEFPDELFFATNGAAWNKLFRTSFMMEHKLAFLPDVKIYEDVYFMIGALALACRIKMVNKVMVHHRLHSQQSRAKLFRKYYAQIPEIYVKARDMLMSRGMYSPLSFGYRNYTADRCYKLYNMLPTDEKGKLWNMLNGEYAERLGWVGKTAEKFADPQVYEFVVNVSLYNYKQYKRFAANKKGQGTAMLDQKVAVAKRRKNIRSFFAKFSKKEK
jgi:glycosyltransferase involved in cell wall biosynthesis